MSVSRKNMQVFEHFIMEFILGDHAGNGVYNDPFRMSLTHSFERGNFHPTGIS